jgi:hypothetical protein
LTALHSITEQVVALIEPMQEIECLLRPKLDLSPVLLHDPNVSRNFGFFVSHLIVLLYFSAIMVKTILGFTTSIPYVPKDISPFTDGSSDKLLVAAAGL